MPTTNKRLVYDDWSAGEFGTKNPAKAPNGSWTGKNMVVYESGRIGPRPGLKKIALSSDPPQFGPMLGMGFSPTAQTGNEQIFFILDDDVYSFDPDDLSLVTVTGTLTSAPPAASDADTVLSKESVRLIGDEVYFVVDNDKPYRLNMRTGVLTAVTTPNNAQGTDIELYRDRMVVCNGSNRVYYSDAADFDTWQVGSFFDVGASYRIISLMEHRDTLVIFTQSGTWVMTGTADDGTLRRVSDTLSPYDKSVVRTNDDLIYIPASRNAPVIFNGSYGDEKSLAHLDDWKNDSVGVYGVQSYGNRDVLFHSNNGDLLWRKNDAWTFHDFEVAGVKKWITRWFDDNVVVANPGSASTYPEFYMLAMNIDRPVIEGSDDWARPGDDSATPLDAYASIPDYLSPEGYECRVRSVTVDFLAYDTGLTSSNPNNIDLVVTSLGRENIDSAESDTATGLFNEDPNDYDASGVYCRRIYKGTPQSYGAGYRIKLDNVVGVAIDRVIVEIEEQKIPVT